ncbi:MAG: ComF family protein [Beijerinckiaceae bacterium]
MSSNGYLAKLYGCAYTCCMETDRAQTDVYWLPEDAAPEHSPFQPQRPPLRMRLRAGISNAARRWRMRAIDAVYPPSCLVCRSALGEPDALCPQCWSAMRLIERPYCERLGTPFAFDSAPGLISPEAFANPPAFGKARAVACFEDGPVRDLVHGLKYGDRVEMAGPMGRWMARAGADLLVDADVLIPVPLHRWRLFSRRFNQAALLAHSVAKATGVPCDPLLLKRLKPTQPQVGKSKAQRADNVQGAFGIDTAARAKIAGKRVVLVDDVLTSGATANAAARVLLRSGAKNVDILVFARVVQDL